MTREEVIEVLEKHLKCMANNKQCLWDITHSCESCEFFTTDEDWIQAESYAVDELQERKTGKWVRADSYNTFKCSVCGNFLNFHGVNAGRGDANYCPNCGAKMEVDE